MATRGLATKASTAAKKASDGTSAMLARLGLVPVDGGGGGVNAGVFAGGARGWDSAPRGGEGREVQEAVNPATGEVIGRVAMGNASDYDACVEASAKAFAKWSATPAPVRGEVVRRIGEGLRARKKDLGALISMEVGKIRSEGEGEVQEYVDICDMAVGMSRQLPGLVLPSERRDHLMLETWHPLGVVGIIAAFNFPCAVVGWNTAISLICGNTQVVKGAETASLVSIATQRVVVEALEASGVDPAVATLCQGRGKGGPGERMVADERVPLVSFTGSTQVGRFVASGVAQRLGRTILELGGNNAIAVMPDADLDMAVRSVLFAAVGTAGQRCTSLRRLLVHESIYDSFVKRLVDAYAKVKIGNPLAEGVLMGPLHTCKAVELFDATVKEATAQGGHVATGGKRARLADASLARGNFVEPTIVEFGRNFAAPLVREERFLPILYVLKVSSLDEAIAVNNGVRQGLTSAVFTRDMRAAFKWIGPSGSDTGISNVNTSCSGAEIGGAFGGNKETGWGRESGSDAWKAYMRRGTCTINFGDALPLAQGVDFTAP